MPYVDGEPKIYDATIRFGAETDTDDPTGRSFARRRSPTRARSPRRCVNSPARSIKCRPHIRRSKSTASARTTPRAAAPRSSSRPSRVTVHQWEVLAQSATDIEVRITCSGGTYVRALARDLGRLSASSAHLTRLRRVSSGQYSVDDAVTLDRVRAGDTPLRPLRDVVASMATQPLDDADRRAVLHGRAIVPTVDGARVALVDDETLIAVAERVGDELRPRIVLADA